MNPILRPLSELISEQISGIHNMQVAVFEDTHSGRLGRSVYVNYNSTWLDTCLITVGSRTLIGPNCSFFSATHPLDPFLRNGTNGPESGKPITIGEDCVRVL